MVCTIGKDYDEFRSFVSASQLKPTSGREVSSLFNGTSGTVAGGYASIRKLQAGQGTVGGFDDIIQKRKDTSGPSASVAKLDANLQSISLENASTENSKGRVGSTKPQSSRAAHDFSREWKLRCKTANDTLSFLARVEDADGSFESNLILQPDSVCKDYFSSDIDSDIAGDIVEALHLLLCIKKGGVDSDASNIPSVGDSWPESSGMPDLLSTESNIFAFTGSWLKALTTCGRFELCISFLSPDQREKLSAVCDYTKANDESAEYLLRYESLLKK